MPVFECCCTNPNCSEYCFVDEHYLPHSYSPDQACEACGLPTHRIPSTFSAPWTGTLDRFREKGYESHGNTEGGHVAYRVRSSRLVGGGPEAVRITTRQEQREYIKAEGLEDPSDINPHMEIGKDGQSASFFGVKGVWAPVAEKKTPRRRVSPEVFGSTA